MTKAYFMYTPTATIRVTYLTDTALARYEAQVEHYVASTKEVPGHWVTTDPTSAVAKAAQDKALRAYHAEELAEMLLATIERTRATLRERGAPDCEALRKQAERILQGAVDEVEGRVQVIRDKVRRGDQ